MKNLLIINLFCCLMMFCISCGNTVDEQRGDKGMEKPEFLGEPEIALSSCADVCPAENPGNYEISKECYDCITGNFKSNAYQFTPYLGQSAKGFKISEAELSELLLQMRENEDASLYAMMGMKVTDSCGEGEAEPELTFVVKDGGEFTYFDFTTPCPNFCP